MLLLHSYQDRCYSYCIVLRHCRWPRRLWSSHRLLLETPPRLRHYLLRDQHPSFRCSILLLQMDPKRHKWNQSQAPSCLRLHRVRTDRFSVLHPRSNAYRLSLIFQLLERNGLERNQLRPVPLLHRGLHPILEGSMKAICAHDAH